MRMRKDSRRVLILPVNSSLISFIFSSLSLLYAFEQTGDLIKD